MPTQVAVLEGERKQWHPLQLTFEGPETSEQADPNPFLSYRLMVTFSHADTSYVVPGFFAADGQAAETSATSGNKWRVYFTPDRTGSWSYQASFRQGNQVAISQDPQAGNPVSFDGAQGSFVVGPSDKLSPDFRMHGRMNYVGTHYLRFEGSGETYIKGGTDSPENFLGYYEFDGTQDNGGNPNKLQTDQPFVSQGVTYTYNNDGLHHFDPHLMDWQAGDPVWQGGKGKRIIGAINYLASEAMNVVYMVTNNVEGDGREVYPWIDYGNRNRYDVSKLAQWEIVFRHMQAKGIVLHFILQETENDNLLDGGELGTDRRLYYRELVARFGHHNAIIWNLGEENTNTHKQRDDFAQYVEAIDPYGHFLTVQTNIGQQNDVYTPFLGKPYFDGAAIQEDYWEVHDETITWIDRSSETGRDWVVFCDEIGPFQIGVSPDGPGNNHHTIRHEVLYANLFAGGAGNEWYFGYDLPHNDLDCEDFRSRDTMWDYTRYSVQFWKDFLPLDRMKHADDLLSVDEGYCFAHPGEVYAVYLPYGGEAQLNLDTLQGSFRLQWFNPRKGGFLQTGTVDSVSGPGWVSLGLPPDSLSQEDWIALVGVPNMAPSFQLAGDIDRLKLNENFEDTLYVEVIPDPVPEEEQGQQVRYTLTPSEADFIQLTFDTLSGRVSFYALPDQVGEQAFTITADDGQESNSRYQQTFTVSVQPPQPPRAVMALSDTVGTLPLSVRFDASLSEDANGRITSVRWNFGNGQTAEGMEATYTYAEAGSYLASLTVVDEDGMIDVVDTLIRVRAPQEAMLLVAKTPLGPGDQALRDSLETWGYPVVIRDQFAAQAEDADQARMVLISSSVTSGVVGGTFSQSAVPVMVWEPYLYDDMQLTGAAAEGDFGHQGDQQFLLIDSLPEGFSWTGPDSLQASGQADRYGWGLPAPSAISIARIPAQPERVAIFAYEAGASMAGLEAPARRIALHWQDDSPTITRPEAWSLAQALVCWAVDCQGDTIPAAAFRLMPLPDQHHEVGDSLALAIATQPERSDLRFSALGLPEGVLLDSLGGTFTGRIQDSLGVYPVQLFAATPDSVGLRDSLAFHWVVFEPAPNLPPTLTPPANQLIEQGDSLVLMLSADDPEGDSLRFYASGLPDSLSLDSLSGRLAGRVLDSVGVYEVDLMVRDLGEPSEADAGRFTLEIIPPIPNQPPVLAPVNDQSGEQGSALSIAFSAQDPDEEDAVFFTISGLPNGLVVDSLQQTISGTLNDSVGMYAITLVAYDNGSPIEGDTLTFRISITERIYRVLFVGGAVPLNAGDQAVVQRLQGLGFEVTVKASAEVSTEDGADQELIYISSTVASWEVNTKFTQLAVPLICAEAYLYDDLNMAAAGNFGNQGGISTAQVLNSAHEIVLGQEAQIETVQSEQEKGWGVPANEGKAILGIPEDPEKALIFTYEAGSQMDGQVAPARRAGMFLRDDTAPQLTPEGWEVVDATICWAAGCPAVLTRNGRALPSGLEAKVFPNPVHDRLHLRFPQASAEGSQGWQLSVVDLLGRPWITRSISQREVQASVSVGALPDGVYLVLLRRGNLQQHWRILKR